MQKKNVYYTSNLRISILIKVSSNGKEANLPQRDKSRIESQLKASSTFEFLKVLEQNCSWWEDTYETPKEI